MDIAGNGALTLSGTAVKYLAAAITNAGTLAITGTGALTFDANNAQVVIQPGGLFDVQGDAAINSGGFAGLQINNAGTFRKSAGTNTSGISAALQNTGTLAVLTGTLSFIPPFTNSGGILAVQLNSASNWGRFAFSGNLGLNGTLRAVLPNTFAPALGSVYPIISAGALSGAFASFDLPVGIAVKTTNNVISLTVNSPTPALLLNPALIGANLTFSIATASNQSYTVERNDNLATTNWVFFSNFLGNGSAAQIVVPISNTPARFLRVREP